MTTLKRMILLGALALGAIAACSSVTRYSSPPQSAAAQASASVSPTPAYNYQH
jgi:hypothetical protein